MSIAVDQSACAPGLAQMYDKYGQQRAARARVETIGGKILSCRIRAPQTWR